MTLQRILYVPNESGNFRQVGFRRPLANLTNSGLIGDVRVFGLEWRIVNGGDPEQHRRDLISTVREFQPDLVLMQHLGRTGLTRAHFAAMRSASEFKLIYHEADPYSRFAHPLPPAAQAAGRSADLVYTVGSGQFADNFTRLGARDVRFSTHVFDPDRFARTEAIGDENRKYDVAVVAHRNTPRLPFRGLPGWRDRIRFVELLSDRLGDRVALYGRGWEGESARGPVEFNQQGEAIRSAWLSANWDHYPNEPRYHSNRLPISLAEGSIHATTLHPGYDLAFTPDHDFLVFGKSPEALVDAIENKLDSTTPRQRLDMARRARDFAFARYRQDDQLVEFLNSFAPHIDPDAAKESWDLDAPTLDEI